MYGINIDESIMTSPYRSVVKNKNKNLFKLKPIDIKELSDKKIKEFHIRYFFVLALSEENKLYSWGWNLYGQLGRNTDLIDQINPMEIDYFTDSRSKIKQICVDNWTVIVLLDNGKVVVWGNNIIEYDSGKSKFGRSINEIFGDNWKKIRKPRELNSLKEIEFIHMNEYGYFAIDKNYNVFSWDIINMVN